MSILNTAFNWLALVFSAGIVFCSLVFAYVLLTPVDVLDTWTIDVSEKSYHPAEEVNVHSVYKKVRNTTGKAYYYLECENAKGRLVRYPISQTEGNKPSGQGDIEIPLKLPENIPDLPNQCRVVISVDYRIYTFRNHTENAQTNWFRMEK